MRFSLFFLFAVMLAVFCAVAAAPADFGQLGDSGNVDQSEEYVQSDTLSALKRFFQPMFDWFKTELPKKTPTDLATDLKETGEDVKDWADESKFVQSTKEVFKPISQWFVNTGNTLKDKTFSDMFEDTKKVASKVDQTVGQWINGEVADSR